MPTARPIIVATVWAMSGTAIRWPSSPITPSAVVSPSTAVPIGMPIATTVPNVNVRMIIAARIPMMSLIEVSLGESTLPIEPPPSTSIPAFLPGSAASITRCAWASVSSLDPTFSSAEMNAVFLSFEICAEPPCWLNGLTALYT